jgi:DNA-binding transcriptional MerR regulator
MQSESEQQQAREKEAAYRRGYSHASDETGRLVLQLVELGYKAREIRRLLAVYDDHFLAPWKAGDLDKREPAPFFDVEKCQKILQQTKGYDWIV